MATGSLGHSAFSLPCPSPLVLSPLRPEREENESVSDRAESLGPRSPSRPNSLSTGTFTQLFTTDERSKAPKWATRCHTASASSGQTYCLRF